MNLYVERLAALLRDVIDGGFAGPGGRELMQRLCIDHDADGRRMGLSVEDHDSLSDAARSRLAAITANMRGVSHDELRDSIHLLVQCRHLAATGMKVYHPTADEFRLCSEVEVRLPWAEFALPFPLVFVTIPDEFGAAFPPIRSATPTADFFPRVVGLLRTGDAFTRTIYSYGPHTTASTRFHTVMMNPPDTFIEETLRQDEQRQAQAFAQRGRDYAAEYADNCLVVVRAAINYVLLVMSSGASRVEGDPRAQAEAERAACRKPGRRRRRELDQAVDRAAEYYRLAQTIEVGQREAFRSDDTSTPDGWKLKPHWRRAHWAAQPHGPGNSLRKKILRPFVFVKPDLFKGERIDTTYEGRTRPQPEEPA